MTPQEAILAKKLLREWVRGYVCAASIAAKIQGSFAGLEIMEEGGLDKVDAEVAGCESSDIEAIYSKKARKNEPAS